MFSKIKPSYHVNSSRTSRTKLRPLILHSARSLIIATTARTRDYTAPLLLNKRVRDFVNGGNGLMYLRPRVHLQPLPETRAAIGIGTLCLHSMRSAGRRNWQSTIHRDWPRQHSRETGKKTRKKRGCMWLGRQTESMH